MNDAIHEYGHAWGSKTYYRQLRIDPLSADSASELLDALLGGDAGLDLLKRLLIERTEANPLFLEEGVRSLVETGALEGERGAYRLTRPIERLTIPATVQAILAAAHRPPNPEAKRLLQAAAVIGKDVALPLLLAIADAPEHEVRAELTRLQGAEFLYEVRFFPDLEYTFKHALTHEVAYHGLLQDRRRDLHARITEAIERLAAERIAEQSERLAHHAPCGELWEKAVAYLREAGLRAMARGAIARPFLISSRHLGRCVICPRPAGEASWRSTSVSSFAMHLSRSEIGHACWISSKRRRCSPGRSAISTDWGGSPPS
jgi:predicted ATPase